MKLTIASVEAVALAAPFARMFDDVPDWLTTPASSHRVLPRLGQYTTLVRIRTVDGLEGIGEAYGLPEPRVTATIIGRLLAPMLVGRDAGASEALWELMFGAQAGAGRTGGFYLEAISGIDLALWDLRGKAAGQPVHRLLGGPVRVASARVRLPDPVPPPATEESAERALSFLDDGFNAVKLKLGRGEATDLRTPTAVAGSARRPGRAARRPQLRLRREDRDPARPRPGATSGVRWLEEPLATDDVAGLAEVRAAVRIPVVTGESEFIRYGYRDLLLARAADVVMPNLTRAGGITEVRRIAALCSAFHVDVSPHGVGSAIGLAAALQFAAATPNVTDLRIQPPAEPAPRRPGRQPPSLVDGALVVPDGAGPRRHPRRGPRRPLRGVPCLNEPWSRAPPAASGPPSPNDCAPTAGTSSASTRPRRTSPTRPPSPRRSGTSVPSARSSPAPASTAGAPAHETSLADWRTVSTPTSPPPSCAPSTRCPACSPPAGASSSPSARPRPGVRAPGCPAYAAAKAGLAAFTRQLAVDYGRHGIRALTVCPGWVRTPDTLTARRGPADRHPPRRAHRRPGEPADVAAAVAFAVSAGAALLTGTEIVLDGGASAVQPAALLRPGSRTRLGLPPLTEAPPSEESLHAPDPPHRPRRHRRCRRRRCSCRRHRPSGPGRRRGRRLRHPPRPAPPDHPRPRRRDPVRLDRLRQQRPADRHHLGPARPRRRPGAHPHVRPTC